MKLHQQGVEAQAAVDPGVVMQGLSDVFQKPAALAGQPDFAEFLSQFADSFEVVEQRSGRRRVDSLGACLVETLP